MLYKKIKKIVFLIVATVVLTGCNVENETNNVDVTKDNIKSTQKKEFEMQQLKTSNATKNISFVSSKYTEFWDAISVNSIDNNYNNNKVIKGNIRLKIKANKEYVQEWIKELEVTYEKLKEIVPEETKAKLKEQYDCFNEYYENTDKMYTYVLDVDDEYESKVDGNYKARQYYSLADDVRTYTILLKEYIFLLTKDVDFYTDDDQKKVIKANYADNTPVLNYLIVVDTKFRDIVNDEYKNKVICNIKGLDVKSAIKKSNTYKKYWRNEVDDNYDVLKETLIGEHKDILKGQKKSYINYVASSIKIQNEILKNSVLYTKIYKENVNVENNIYKGKKMMKYNTLLVEYYYAVTGKIS